ncbi:hypothetical protein A2U01_0067085, partial [Trifolium medium]|nr:hypothetical protein [Trifolium medium]
MDEEYEGNVE